MLKKLLRHKYLILSFLIALFSIRALFHTGLPPTHDGEYHVIRFYEFYKALEAGFWYPRWAPDLNYGMGAPLFNFVYPFPNYISAALHFFGISFIDAFKLNFILATITASVLMYFLGKLHFGERGGVIAATFYIFAPYWFLDVFIRGSVGEVWALAFFPAFLYSLTRLIADETNKYIALASIFLALTVFSHNILGLMFISFSIFYLLTLLNLKNLRIKLLPVLVSYVLGLGLSAIFWAPALLEKKYVRGLDIFNINGNFPEVFQLLFPSWGSGFSGASLSGQMSFQIGLANLFIVFIALLLLIKLRRKIKKEVILFIVSFFVVFFLMIKSSSLIWENLPLLYFFQFPWRLLSLEIFISAFLAGFVITHVLKIKNEKVKKLLFLGVLLFPILTTLSYSRPAFYHERNDSYYTARENFISGTNSPGNAFNTIWTDGIDKKDEVKIIEGEGKIKVDRKEFSLQIDSRSDTEAKILSNIMYFHGWALNVDGQEKEIMPGVDGRIEFTLPKGESNASLQLKNTNVQSLASIISFISLSILILLLLRLNYTIIRE